MIVKTYSELAFFVNMFKNRNSDLMILESKGGTGKSKLVQDVMSETPHLRILSHITPLQLFILGYKYRDVPIVIDDVDGLLNNDQTVSLLKMFCETSKIKEIAWFTTHNLLTSQGIPQKFETSSKVIILTNDFKQLSKKIGALKDRGWHIKFQPTDSEILSKIKEIMPAFSDINYQEKSEVFNLIEKYSRFCDFSLRTFVKGVNLYKECKNKNVSWKNLLLKEMGINDKLILLDNIMSKYNQEKDRVKEWENCGHSKRSYYDYKTKLVQKGSHFGKKGAYLHKETKNI